VNHWIWLCSFVLGPSASTAKPTPASQPLPAKLSKLKLLHSGGLAMRFDVVDYRSSVWLPKNGWIPANVLASQIMQRFPSVGRGEPVVVTIGIVKARADQGILHATGDVALRASIWRGGHMQEFVAQAQTTWRKVRNDHGFVTAEELEPEIDVLALAMDDALSDLAAQVDAWLAGSEPHALKHAAQDPEDEEAGMIAIDEAKRRQQQMMHHH
jgi:hypothetical protein